MQMLFTSIAVTQFHLLICHFDCKTPNVLQLDAALILPLQKYSRVQYIVIISLLFQNSSCWSYKKKKPDENVCCNNLRHSLDAIFHSGSLTSVIKYLIFSFPASSFLPLLSALHPPSPPCPQARHPQTALDHCRNTISRRSPPRASTALTQQGQRV